ncbi:NADH:ubiquinone oxidoreductase subunit NDUFA12 [Sinisalibacter lacisalsi]|uniref:NADH:ubiquinone oxidoreductase subunit NDUFA12 n=1 Tax=Sinisalibacter lacisalsi TaxID=1526570 RepID=A0ABQ1QSS0_9RHOB|nr:NADH:ubiquinone oxidoreductase subunit NDUFA12 [Sinisalibacter lacisalsi]GGD44295.1 NADH:ubiquinone oxidoreductase subunit NDUFA12 [Sinisalibacter lacisalsi]
MRFILSLITWYHGETLGTRLMTRFRGAKVGEDELGNIYYRNRDDSRRWVIYSGEPEASKVPAEWHGWLHHTFDENPAENPLPHKAWEKTHHDNLTGTALAYVPAGSIRREDPAERRDYEAWQPE